MRLPSILQHVPAVYRENILARIGSGRCNANVSGYGVLLVVKSVPSSGLLRHIEEEDDALVERAAGLGEFVWYRSFVGG